MLNDNIIIFNDFFSQNTLKRIFKLLNIKMAPQFHMQQKSVLNGLVKRTQIYPLFTCQDYLYWAYVKIIYIGLMLKGYILHQEYFILELMACMLLTLSGFGPFKPSSITFLWILCQPLAKLQHIGVDMEADIGEVLLGTESGDITATLLLLFRRR